MAIYNAKSILENPDRIPQDTDQITVYEMVISETAGENLAPAINLLLERGWRLDSMKVTNAASKNKQPRISMRWDCVFSQDALTPKQ